VVKTLQAGNIMSRKISIAMGMITLIVIGLVAVNLTQGRVYRFQGAEIHPTYRAPDFILTDQYDQAFQLKDQTGKLVLLTFGYTTCPDVCPVTLADFRRLRIGLGSMADSVIMVFITVDPERDTPERLQEYLANFDPIIIGLTGRISDLEVVWADYGISVKKNSEGSAAGYLVDHTARTFLIDQEGNLRLTYVFGTRSEVILNDMQHLLGVK
jgi:protein SCO1/2